MAAIKSCDQRLKDWALYQFYADTEIKSWVNSYIINKGGNNEDAEDVFQESIIIFDRNIRSGKFEGKSSLKTYLLAVVKWAWLSYRRKRGYSEEFKPEMINDLDDGLEFIILEEERSQLVESAIDQLDTRCQELLRYYKLDYSMKDIQSKMGFSSPEMAKKQAYRCRERLRNYFLSQPKLLSELNINIV